MYECMYVCMYVYIHIYMYVCMYVYVHIYICMYVCMYVYIHIYICMYVCMYVCKYTCIYIYICIYIYMYMYNFLAIPPICLTHNNLTRNGALVSHPGPSTNTPPILCDRSPQHSAAPYCLRRSRQIENAASPSHAAFVPQAEASRTVSGRRGVETCRNNVSRTFFLSFFLSVFHQAIIHGKYQHFQQS